VLTGWARLDTQATRTLGRRHTDSSVKADEVLFTLPGDGPLCVGSAVRSGLMIPTGALRILAREHHVPLVSPRNLRYRLFLFGVLILTQPEVGVIPPAPLI
jgi:hypothetical protein